VKFKIIESVAKKDRLRKKWCIGRVLLESQDSFRKRLLITKRSKTAPLVRKYKQLEIFVPVKGMVIYYFR